MVLLNPGVGAWYYRGVIRVTTGMLEFAESDDMLAFVLGHELAHAILAHRGWVGKAGEREADYLGTYLAARSGFDVTRAPEFWTRFFRAAPWSVSHYKQSHEGTPERALLVEATVREIQEKQARGEPHEPELDG